MKEVLLIGDLASRTGLSIHTINYYLKLGLIEAKGRAERSGFRIFNLDSLEVLQRIVELRRSHVPIKELIARKRDGVL
jgi:DNA-binding transcriptional MerR regulator